MVKILLDTLGLDKGFEEVVLAAVNSVKTNKNIELTLVGDEDKITSQLNNYNGNFEQIKVINAPIEISCNDIPTKAIKEKKDSSLVVCLDKLKEGYDAIISGGSTGAVLTGGFLKIGRIKGISRPALCPMLPTLSGGRVMLIDSGANVDCKPLNLCHFALMGKIYMENILNINNPKIALLNIGAEENKGNELAKETYPLLKDMNINFIGNLEARDFLSGKADIVVSDGFSGNVLLKGTEGAVMMVMKKLKTEIKSSFWSKIGAIFMKKTFKKLKSELNIEGLGGSILLGLKKILIKVHGSSGHVSFENAIKQVVELKENKVIEKLENEFLELNLEG